MFFIHKPSFFKDYIYKKNKINFHFIFILFIKKLAIFKLTKHLT